MYYLIFYGDQQPLLTNVKVLGMTVEKGLKRSGTFSGAAQEIEDFDVYRMGKPERVTPYYLVHRGKFQENCKAIEEAFEIEISDDEICYMMITLYPNTYDAAVA